MHTVETGYLQLYFQTSAIQLFYLTSNNNLVLFNYFQDKSEQQDGYI